MISSGDKIRYGSGNVSNTRSISGVRPSGRDSLKECIPIGISKLTEPIRGKEADSWIKRHVVGREGSFYNLFRKGALRLLNLTIRCGEKPYDCLTLAAGNKFIGKSFILTIVNTNYLPESEAEDFFNHLHVFTYFSTA
jgi:hypothetical protein